ncbi:MAG TPA: hypothetical protein DCM40_34030, partial [Maribacter sp.]|nr:hypothetical protein [Maribacter sp.]
ESLRRLEAELQKDSEVVTVYRKGDNARVLIQEKVLVGGASLPANMNMMSPEDQQRAEDNARRGGEVYETRAYEFYTVDSTLDDFDLSKYPRYVETQTAGSKQLPQTSLLSDFIGREINSSLYDGIMANVFSAIRDEITGPEMESRLSNGIPSPSKPGWLYGAEYDDLKLEDIDYVVDSGQTKSGGGTLYGNAEVADYNDDGERDGNRKISNDDMILGISRMQYEEQNGSGRKNRVFYLDPGTYGGTYPRPKLYIKPVQNKGWRGMVDAIFPELSPCKPSKRNLVDFDDIDKQ